MYIYIFNSKPIYLSIYLSIYSNQSVLSFYRNVILLIYLSFSDLIPTL